MENSRRFKICNVDVPRAPKQKHLRSKKHLENEKQNGYLKNSKHLLKNKLKNI